LFFMCCARAIKQCKALSKGRGEVKTGLKIKIGPVNKLLKQADLK